MNNERNNYKLIQPLLISVCLSVGVFIGWRITAQEDPSHTVHKSSNQFSKILQIIEEQYADSVDTDELVEYSIEKMLEKLDPHTRFVPGEKQEYYSSHLKSDFEGIGIEFDIIHDTLYVIAPIHGGPSDQVGIHPGDQIIEVEGKTIAGIQLTTEDVIDLLRGKSGSEVNISIKRISESELIPFKIVRAQIPNYSVDASFMINNMTGYLKINRFAESTYSEFLTEVKKLKLSGMQHLILDLRDNGGGLMKNASRIADEFLPAGRRIVFTKGKNKLYNNIDIATPGGIFEEGAVTVLVNENSASASEIVAGALQDNDRALIVGRRTFGKGLVQLPISLDDGAELRLTISRYYTPSGRCIQKPYDGNFDDYHAEHLLREEHTDSIPIIDSLTYRTLSGRYVHGGGGILPDYYVEKDTSEVTPFLIHLWNQDIIRKYCIEYVNANKSILDNMSFEAFQTSFLVDDEIFEQIIERAKKDGIHFNATEYAQSHSYIEITTKALIARGLYGREAYFKIFNQRDPFILKALQMQIEAQEMVVKHHSL